MDEFWHQHELELREQHERITQNQRQRTLRKEGQSDLSIVGMGMGRGVKDRLSGKMDGARMEQYARHVFEEWECDGEGKRRN